MFSRRRTKATCIALGSFFCAVSQAQAIPDAGSILRDQQSGQLQQPLQRPASEVKKDQSPVNKSGIRVLVKGFTFIGYDGVATESELQAITSSYIGKTIFFSELQLLVETVTANLKNKGWFLAKAYLPKQDVTSGVIEIAVSQGKSDGTLSIKRDKSARINTTTVQRIGELAIRNGHSLNEKKLERSVLLMSDLPGVNARASLAPGKVPNSSGVEISVTEGPLFSGTAWTDNQGNIYTGALRGNLMLSLNDPLRYGDQMTLLLTEASGLTQGRIGYSFPVARDGLRANLAYSAMRYELGGELAGLQLKGQSHNIDAGLSYSMIRSRNSNLSTSFSYGFKSLLDTQAASDLRDKQLSSATIGMNGGYNDQFFGGGSTNLNLGMTAGSIQESVASTEGRYRRLNFGVSRLQRLAPRLSLNLSLSAQSASDNLDSSEKFTLGGPNALRAYPVGEGAGDEGQLITADLRYNLPVSAKLGIFQVSGFIDAGNITLQKNEVIAPSTATNRNNYWLQGAGLGFNYAYSGTFSLRGSWAHVIGDNPGRTAAGNNADGHSDKSRFWMQAMFYF